jgi:hypothetical protein
MIFIREGHEEARRKAKLFQSSIKPQWQVKKVLFALLRALRG